MNLRFTLKKTSEINQSEEKQISEEFARAFGTRLPSNDYFNWKYRCNPNGDSLHLIAFVDNEFAGCRTFWNIGAKDESYQCVDTFTLQEYRKVGIFQHGTEFLIKHYNFNFFNCPNENSEPQYKKYGWEINTTLKPKLSNFNAMKSFSPEINWTKETLQWRYKKHPVFKYLQFTQDSKFFIFRVKRHIPILLGYSYSNPELRELYKPLSIFCACYDSFPGLAIEFGRLTKIYSKNSRMKHINAYWLDML